MKTDQPTTTASARPENVRLMEAYNEIAMLRDASRSVGKYPTNDAKLYEIAAVAYDNALGVLRAHFTIKI